MERQKRLIQEDLDSEVAAKRKRVIEPLEDGLME